MIETLCAAKDPPLDAVLNGIYQRMSLVEAALSQAGATEFSSPAATVQIGRSASKGVDDLWRHLANSGYDDDFRELVGAMIALTGQLMELALSLAESAPILQSKIENTVA